MFGIRKIAHTMGGNKELSPSAKTPTLDLQCYDNELV